jgi:hypothetical protein
MNNLKKTALLALAVAAFAGRSAEAAVLTYTPGDLFLGFRSSASTTDYLINIGQASIYRDAAPGTSFQLTIGTIAPDLVAVFGSNWNSASRPDLFWGVAGSPANVAAGGDATNTLYATAAEVPFGTPAPSPASPGTNSAQAAPANKMLNLSTNYTLAGDSANGVSPAINPAGLRQDGTVAGSWASFMGGTQAFTGNSFSYFAGGIEGNFSAGEEGTAIDLFRISKNPGGVASLAGTFTINDTGLVTYAVAAVPEPTSGALLCIGGALVGLARRRRLAINA